MFRSLCVVRSRLMGGRSGRVNSARSRKCGQGGVAGAGIMTSQQVCEGSTGKRSPQGMENGLRAPQHRVERKKGGTTFSVLRPWKRRQVKGSKEGKGFRQGEKAAWKKSGVWRWTKEEAPEGTARCCKVLVCSERVSGKPGE